MSKNIIAFSDFHLHIYESFAKPDTRYPNDRFRAQIDTLQKVFDTARENNADVMFAGDLFHQRSRINDIVFNEAYRVIAENPDIKTYLLRGNHDSRNNQTDSPHWLETFKYLPHVTVFSVPDSVQTSDFNLYAIPYSDDVAFLKQEIAKFAAIQKNETKPGILMAHVGVDGSETGRYSHRLEGAFKVGDLYPDVFDYVILGHYHKRQFLGGLDNVFYCGNTIQTSFSDEGQEKGVFSIDLNTMSKPNFVPLPNKKFVTLTEIDGDTQNIVDNNYVRFILPEDKAQEVEIFREESDNIRVEVQREYKTETRIAIGMDSTEEDIVEAYTKEFYPDTTNLALEILKEAKTK